MLRLIVIIVFFILIRFCIQQVIKIVGFINKTSKNLKNNNNSIQDLTQCKYCGLYISIEEAVYYNGNTFCCMEHVKK